MKNWYEIKNKDNGQIDISLHDEIGYWGVSAADFISDLQSHKNAKSINLSIHSPGGNMLDGFAIHNALKAHPAKVYSHVTGIAASAASTVLMAGDVITMPEDSFIMIHNPSGFADGGSDELREVADVMDKLKSSAVNIYAKKTGQTDEFISEMMDAETWLNSFDALEHGFIDTVTDSIGVANKGSLFDKHFKTMPFKNNDKQVEKIQTIKDFEKYLRDSGGFSRRLAATLSSRAKELFQGDPDPQNSAAMQEVLSALERINIPASL